MFVNRKFVQNLETSGKRKNYTKEFNYFILFLVNKIKHKMSYTRSKSDVEKL